MACRFRIIRNGPPVVDWGMTRVPCFGDAAGRIGKPVTWALGRMASRRCPRNGGEDRSAVEEPLGQPGKVPHPGRKAASKPGNQPWPETTQRIAEGGPGRPELWRRETAGASLSLTQVPRRQAECEAMDVRNDMLSRVRNRREGFSLDQAFYIDPEYFKLDLDLIWYRDWLFVGHDCEVAKAGSFFTVQVGDYPVVILRDSDGQIRAFHNSCRHRGSRVCTEHRGSSARLVCPYHQWTYDLDGSLLYARQMAEDFDKSQFSLKPVACESVAGYIFICLADKPAEFAPFAQLMQPYFAPHRLTEAKVAFESTIIEKGNWKLVWENNRECYHCAGNHPELCKTYPEAPTVTGVAGGDEDPDLTEHWTRLEAGGLPSRFQMHESGQFRACRTPLIGDAVSYTISGRPAVQELLSAGVSQERIGALLLFHYPTTWNHVLSDHAVTFRVLPISATETAVTTKWLVNKDAVEGVDYDLDTLTHVWMQTNDQDRRIVEENAFGIKSPAYEPGPYSELHEGGVMQFVDWYCRNVETRLTTGAKPLRSVA